MSISDLSKTQWTFQETPSLINSNIFDITFQSNNIIFSTLKSNTDSIKYNYVVAYGEGTLPYLTFSSRGPFKIYRNVASGSAASTFRWDGQMEYSTDTYNWTIWEQATASSTTSPLVAVKNAGQYCVFLRGIGNTFVGTSGTLTTTNDVNTLAFGQVFIVEPEMSNYSIFCTGNLETLLDYQTVMRGEHPTIVEPGFERLFQNQQSLASNLDLTIPNPPAHCYEGMFSNNHSLTIPPRITAPEVVYAETFAAMFGGSTGLQSGILDLRNTTTLGDYSLAGFSDNFYPEIYLGPKLQSLGNNVFTYVGSTTTSSSQIFYGGHNLSLHFCLTDADVPKFDVSKIVTSGLATLSGKDRGIAYKIYTDNTIIKEAVLAKADEYTTVNVYHLDGGEWLE